MGNERIELQENVETAWAIGVDLGGTKCAAGLVSLADGSVLSQCRCSSLPMRGGMAVLENVHALIDELLAFARQQHLVPRRVGIGIAELVSPAGEIASNATFDWQYMVPSARAQLEESTGLPVFFDADVRAAAKAEGRWGHGRGRHHFLYVSVGTGISASLVVNGQPYMGARGLTGTFASARTLGHDAQGQLHVSSPLESFSSGPAIVRRFHELVEPSDVTRAEDVLSRAFGGHESAHEIIRSSGRALGASIGQLVNMLDPEVVVLGGGLGVVEGPFRQYVEQSMRDHIWSGEHRELPLLSSALGACAGMLGAALAGDT